MSAVRWASQVRTKTIHSSSVHVLYYRLVRDAACVQSTGTTGRIPPAEAMVPHPAIRAAECAWPLSFRNRANGSDSSWIPALVRLQGLMDLRFCRHQSGPIG